MLEFWVPGPPKAKGRPRFSRQGHAYTPAATREAEKGFADRAMEHCPAAPLSGPLRLDVRFVMAIPKSTSRRMWEALMGRPHVKKPDLDNLLKLVKDALNGTFWIDDSQVYDVTATKVYGEHPGTMVAIRPDHEA